MLNEQAFDLLGPMFAERGWIFFAPYRRGQGLSADAGPFIGDQIAAARNDAAWQTGLLTLPCVLLLAFLLGRKRRLWARTSWTLALSLVAALAIHFSAKRAAAASLAHLLQTDHLSDQMAAYEWLRTQPFVDPSRIAAAGNSFGGIQTVLGAEHVAYCAAVDATGAAESWAASPDLRQSMTRAVRHSRAPIFFFQAQNDYDLSPSRALSEQMQRAGKLSAMKIYPPYGKSAAEGHSFAWRGSQIWAADVFAFLNEHCGG